MQTGCQDVLMFAYFGLGEEEIILILALILFLVGASKLPKIGKGLGLGLSKFREELAREASNAGRSVGGIYGKRAAQALTPDNKVAELYDPAVFHRAPQSAKRRGRFARRLLKFWLWIRKCVVK